MNIPDLMLALSRQPFPLCGACGGRAHGLFIRRVSTMRPEDGDEIVAEKPIFIKYKDKKDPTLDKYMPATSYKIARAELLCAKCGFSLAETKLIKSLGSKFINPEPAPEKLMANGMKMSDVLTTVRRKEHPSTIPKSILNSWNGDQRENRNDES